MSKLNVWSFICALIAFGSMTTKVQAQIISDGSLNTIVNCGAICNITGGKTDITGKNLFHSFSNFSVSTGANFINPVITENIFARVTGTNSSNIDGLIQTNGSANLFLLNPNGIIFGPGARLNIGGSFVATTANSIQFGNTGNFGVNTGNNVALLNIKPSALLFNQINAQSIQTNLANLQTAPNKSLIFVGGNVDINSSNLSSPNGNIELAAIQGTGTVQFNQNSTNLSLNPITNIPLGNMSIQTSLIDSGQYQYFIIPISSGNIQLQGQNITLNQSNIIALTTLGNGGNININAGKLMLNNDSFIGTGTFGISPAGNITINASESIELIGNDQAGLIDDFLNDSTNINSLLNSINNTILSLSDGSGKVGNITINTGNLSIKNGFIIGGISGGTGQGGNINVNAREINIIGAEKSNIKFEDFAEDIAIGIPNIVTGIGLVTTGNAQNNGDIIINTSEFNGINPGGILNMTLGKGNTGNVVINSLNNIFLDNRSVIGTVSLSNDITNPVNIQQVTGQVGNVKITTSQLTLNLRSGFSSTTFGTGNAGNIEININNGLLQNGATITTSSGLPRIANITQFNSAKAGNLIINAANKFTLDTGSVIYSQSATSGNAGNIIINTPILQIFDGVSGFTNSTFGKGDAGNITINANKLDIRGNTPGAFTPSNQVVSEILVFKRQVNLNGVASVSFGIGKAGNINIHSQEINLINGGGIINSNLAEGKGGKIDIFTTILNIVGKSAIISASGSLSLENAGEINIIANILNLDQGGSIAVDTLGKGNAGNLFIKGENLNILNGSRISAGTTFDSLGNGGNITLEFPNINIMGRSLDKSFPSQISTATNNNGIAGNINIISDILNINNMGEVNTNTSSSGRAGNINFFIKREINLDNGKILANTLRSSSGNGGSIFIDPEVINMKNSRIEVNSQGTGTGGNIEIIVGRLSLDNSVINGETISTDGGNIKITSNGIIFMNNNSKISTTAGTENAGGNGGNIRIDNQFLIAFPNNNDITANAYFGNGGRVEINTQGLFNIEPRFKLTDGNDITASSQFGINGEVIINTPGIDPNPVIKLIEKIENKDVNQVCSPKVIEKNTFITGSGGLPFNPSEQLRNEQYIVNNGFDNNNQNKADSKPLVEATNWQKNAQGEIILIANNNNYVQSVAKCN